MPNHDYWIDRMSKVEAMANKKGMDYTAFVDKQFQIAQKNIEQKIEYWYAKIAENNEIGMSAAHELLRRDELEDFHLSIEEYIEKGKNLAYDNRWEKQLKNASAKVHIQRLEALKMQMQQECEVLFGGMADGLDDTLADIYSSTYYHTAYEYMRGCSVGWAFNRLDNRRIKKALETCWTNDNETFSSRVWKNKNRLVNELNTVLTQSIIRGESPQKAISLLSKKMKTSRYNAGRLIMTESSAIYSASQKDCYKELDVEKYEIVATLDSSTSDICRELDGKVFDMSDYKVGLTAPPFHCFCRTCTVPYFPDEDGQRIARGEDGKTYYVPANMTYDEWYKKFVENDKTGLQEVHTQTIDDINKIATDRLLQSYEERRIHFGLNETPAAELKDSALNTLIADYNGVSVDTARMFNETINNLSEQYYTGLTRIEVADKKTVFGANFFARTQSSNAIGQKTLVLNPHKMADYEKMTQRIKELSDKGYSVRIAEGLEGRYIATHEFAHSLIDLSGDYKNFVGIDVKKMKGIKKELDSVFDSYKDEVTALEAAYKEKELAFLNASLSSNVDMDDIARMQNEAIAAKEALDKVKISKYSLENADEFMAEAFTQSKIGVSQSLYSDKVMDIIDRNFKKVDDIEIIGISGKIEDIVNEMSDVASVKTNADKKNFAKKFIEKLGIDADNIDIRVKKMPEFGACKYINDGSDTANYFEYALRSNDVRDMKYQIKTAYHEAYHLSLNGNKWDIYNDRKKWSEIEETFAEASAHYAASLHGITDLSPSYSEKLIRTLPRLKKLPEYAQCKTISDFGKIAWEERLSGKGGVWESLYDKAFAEKFDKAYYKKYFEYMEKNKESLIDKMLENMPECECFRNSMIKEFDSAMERVKETGNIDVLAGNEKIVFNSTLINAMNKEGI